MTPIIFLLTYALGIFGALFADSLYGVFTYLFAFHMSPESAWWEHDVPALRYLMFAAIVAAISTAIRDKARPGEQWYEQTGFKFLVAFNVWLWLLNLWVISPIHLDGSVLFLKHLVIAVIVYRVAVDKELSYEKIMLAIVIGCGWFGWQTMGKSGRVEGVAGAVSDANTLGMHTAAGLMLCSIMVLGFKGRYRWIAFFCAPLILNTIIQAGSRGAFLALVCGGLVSWQFCPKSLKPRFTVLATLGVVLFLMLAHNQFLDRLTALFVAVEDDGQELDGSASSRIDIIKAQWRMALDYPMGVGHRGTAILSPYYMDESLLTGGSRLGVEAARSAHNSYMAVLVEYGFIGFFLYMLLLGWCALALLRLRRLATIRGDPHLGLLTGAIAAGLTVVVVGGMFSNFSYAEIQFWLIGLLNALLVNARRLGQVRNEQLSPRAISNAEATPHGV